MNESEEEQPKGETRFVAAEKDNPFFEFGLRSYPHSLVRLIAVSLAFLALTVSPPGIRIF